MGEFIIVFLSLNTSQNMLEIFHSNKFLSQLQSYRQTKTPLCVFVRKNYKILLASTYLWIMGCQRVIFSPL